MWQDMPLKKNYPNIGRHQGEPPMGQYAMPHAASALTHDCLLVLKSMHARHPHGGLPDNLILHA